MTQESIFYERLSELIKQTGKSRNQIERELGYPRNSLNNYRYAKEPSGSRLVELAHYLQVTPEYLLGRVDYNAIPTTQELYQDLTVPQRYEMLQLCQAWLLEQSLEFSPSS